MIFMLYKNYNDHGYKYLKNRTVLIKSNQRIKLKEIEIMNQINEILTLQGSSGKLVGYLILPDYKRAFRNYISLTKRIEYRKIYLQKQTKLNSFTAYVYPNRLKTQEAYKKVFDSYKEKVENQLDEMKQSNYIVACFDSYQAIVDIYDYYKHQKNPIKSMMSKVFNQKDGYNIDFFFEKKDVYWKHCYFQKILDSNFLTWKIFHILIMVGMLIFLTTPTALIYLILDSELFAFLTGRINENKNSFGRFLLFQFIPPLVILGINRLFFFIIYRSTQRQRKLRFSTYHKIVLKNSYIYVMLNNVIIPGFIVTTGTNIFQFMAGLQTDLRSLLSNFYQREKISFFFIMIVQKTAFSFFALASQFGLLIHYYLSPTTFLYLINKRRNIFHNFMNRETSTFNFGYSYSLNIMILAVIFIFSSHSCLFPLFGLLYFCMRILIDAHVLLNVTRSKIEGTDQIFHLASKYILINLIFAQLSTILEGVFVSTISIFIIMIPLILLTLIIYYINLKRPINYQLFQTLIEEKKFSEEDLNYWKKQHQHPFEKVFETEDIERENYFNLSKQFTGYLKEKPFMGFDATLRDSIFIDYKSKTFYKQNVQNNYSNTFSLNNKFDRKNSFQLI